MISTKRSDQHTATVISQVPAVVAIVVHCHEDLALSRLEDFHEQIEQWNQSYLVHGGSFAFWKDTSQKVVFLASSIFRGKNPIVETTTSTKRPTSSYILIDEFCWEASR